MDEPVDQPLQQRERKQFTSLPDALEFVSQCLESNTVFPLLAEVRRAPRQRPSSPPPSADGFNAVFKQLQSIHAEQDLRRLYAGVHFPEDDDYFQLHGFLERTADIDVRFVRLPQGWVLAGIEFL